MTSQTRNLSGLNTLSEWIKRSCGSWIGHLQSRRLKTGFSREIGDFRNETHLVARAADGDARAQKELIRRLKPDVFKVARAISGTRHHPADLAEVMLVGIFRKLDEFPADQPFSNWSMQTAIAVGIRETKDHPETCSNEDWTEADAGLLSALDTGNGDAPPAEVSQLLDRVLDRLAPAERLVKRLHSLECQTIESISRWTGWSTSEVGRYFFNAERRIEELLGEICSRLPRRSVPLER